MPECSCQRHRSSFLFLHLPAPPSLSLCLYGPVLFSRVFQAIQKYTTGQEKSFLCCFSPDEEGQINMNRIDYSEKYVDGAFEYRCVGTN